MEIDGSTHRQLAIEANNSTWESLGKDPAEITADEADEMTQRAYAAAYHWSRAEGRTAANDARAHWLLSRVWSVRGVGELALQHAQRCLSTCESAGLVDFDLAYAQEAMARALACLGDASLARQHLDAARAVSITDPDDRALVEADLHAEPWFGLC